MGIFKQNRFREITVDEIIERIRASDLYEIRKRIDDSEMINLDEHGTAPLKTQLWDGTPIKKIHEARVGISRVCLPDNPNRYREIEDRRKYLNEEIEYEYRLNAGLIEEEVVGIIGVTPSFPPRDTWYSDFHIAYDRLTPEREYPMERIRVSVDRRITKIEPN
jgi:hypothetical protein